MYIDGIFFGGLQKEEDSGFVMPDLSELIVGGN